MAIAYSKDLRLRALNLLDSGKSITQVSRLLSISRPTLYRWRWQWETTGSIAAKKSVPPPQPGKIQDWQKFREFIDKNGERTQEELAVAWGGVTRHTISRGLKKIGYSRKKKRSLIKSVVKKHGQSLKKN
ncbi:MAG: IS630 transposase-related protein [Oscillatoria sp. PMC 1076.18]|nr:IS630 transposase-related protein [Oscillatoria sp. PMC 1076.18]